MIKVLIAGLPGNMATAFAKHAIREGDIDVLDVSLTGNETDVDAVDIDGILFHLIKADNTEGIDKLFEENTSVIVVDYTEPHVVKDNIDLYYRKNVNFIIGTTGVSTYEVEKVVKESEINAIVAPNMGKQIVAIQAMMEHAASNFPDCFKGYKLTVKESHQSGKLDTSGTAKAIVGYFNKLGINFDEDEIIQCRDSDEQLKLGVPAEHLEGHGWHTYAFTSADGSAHFEITHNVNGRDIYAKGTIDAIHFLNKQIQTGVSGRAFTMIEVLRNA